MVKKLNQTIDSEAGGLRVQDSGNQRVRTSIEAPESLQPPTAPLLKPQKVEIRKRFRGALPREAASRNGSGAVRGSLTDNLRNCGW